MLKDVYALARTWAGLVLIRAGARLAGVPERDSRESLFAEPPEEADFRGPVVTPEAASMIAREEPTRRERQKIHPDPIPGTREDLWQRAARGRL